MSNSDQGQLRSIILVYGPLFAIDSPYVSHGPSFLITDRYCGPGRLLNKVLYGEAPPGGSNPCPLIYRIFTKMAPFLIPPGKAKTIEFPLIATFFPGFLSFWFSCVVISAKMWHPLICFALATISSALQLTVWPFRILKWQFSLPFNILRAWKRHRVRAEPPRIAHTREYPPGFCGWRSVCRGCEVHGLYKLYGPSNRFVP